MLPKAVRALSEHLGFSPLRVRRVLTKARLGDIAIRRIALKPDLISVSEESGAWKFDDVPFFIEPIELEGNDSDEEAPPTERPDWTGTNFLEPDELEGLVDKVATLCEPDGSVLQHAKAILLCFQAAGGFPAFPRDLAVALLSIGIPAEQKRQKELFDALTKNPIKDAFVDALVDGAIAGAIAARIGR